MGVSVCATTNRKEKRRFSFRDKFRCCLLKHFVCEGTFWTLTMTQVVDWCRSFNRPQRKGFTQGNSNNDNPTIIGYASSEFIAFKSYITYLNVCNPQHPKYYPGVLCFLYAVYLLCFSVYFL